VSLVPRPCRDLGANACLLPEFNSPGANDTFYTRFLALFSSYGWNARPITVIRNDSTRFRDFVVFRDKTAWISDRTVKVFTYGIGAAHSGSLISLMAGDRNAGGAVVPYGHH